MLFTCDSVMQDRGCVDRSKADEVPGAQAQLKAARWLGRAPGMKHHKHKEPDSKTSRLTHTEEILTSHEHGADKKASA